MILSALAPAFQSDLEALQAAAAKPSLWHDDIAACIAAYTREIDTDTALTFIQRARRVLRLFTCGLEQRADVREVMALAHLSNWPAFSEPPAARELQNRLADMLYIVQTRADVPLLELGDQTRYIGARLFDRCVADGLAFDVAIEDGNFMAILLANADDAGITRLADHYLESRARVDVRILAHQNLPVWDTLEPPAERQKLFRGLIKPFRERVLSGKMRSVLTSIPTVRDAAVDGIEYADYTDLYFRMCDQPWDAIKAAQYKLIAVLDKTKLLRFTNNDGTDLSMNVDGFTFCNSVVARNIPGSEVFSAPHADSVSGTIVSKGRFMARDEAGAIMEDLTLRFDKGLLVEAYAAKGQDHLERAISIDEGARRVGEIGIGTNPYLKRHVASILLSEKIGGSFHVALGDSYTMTDYMGDPVHVDNGNRSHLHWDITTMLVGKQGRIEADGQAIMVDGLFTDPALDVINRGWAALPYDQRPPLWQKTYPEK